MAAGMRARAPLRQRVRKMQGAVAALHDAGVTLVMGSDSGNWPVFLSEFHGPTSVREVELLGEAGIDADLRTLELEFDEASAFRVPRLNNYMRFVGRVEGRADTAMDPVAEAKLRAALTELWPQLCSVVVLPIGDNLTPTKNRLMLTVDGDRFELRFDLEAD